MVLSAADRGRLSGKARARKKPDADVVTPGLKARRAATRLLSAVVDAKTSLDGLTDNDNGHPQYLALELRDRALVRAILATALRYRVTISTLIAERLDRPLPPKAHALAHVLHVAAAQILFLDVPDSAAVDIAVTQARHDPRTARFSNLVNAVLREIGRRKDRALPAALSGTIDAPDWFIERLSAAYGEENAMAIHAAHRIEAPVDLTVKSDAVGWAARLGGMPLPSGGVRLAKMDGPITALPGFAEGEWWVQDAAASIPAQLLGDIAGKSVADLCAAPGGKTAQLALAGARVTAVEINANRARRLETNLARLDLPATIVVSDLFKFEPDMCFDALLLDSPCSSTGTVRRHPDVAWTKDADDIAKLAKLQRRMVEAAIPMLNVGGRMVFSNCSLDPDEGEKLIASILRDRDDLVLDPIRPEEHEFLMPFLTPEGMVRTTPAGLPNENSALAGLDGFFASRLRRLH